MNLFISLKKKGVYSEIRPFNVSFEEIRDLRPNGIILSGGPESVYDESAPRPDFGIFDLGFPILGICYGLQLLAHLHNGAVFQSAKREYGLASLRIDDHSDLLKDLETPTQVWMSHGDALTHKPEGCVSIAHTDNSPYASIANREKQFYGVQFHPEVTHTVEGQKVLGNFLFQICDCSL